MKVTKIVMGIGVVVLVTVLKMAFDVWYTPNYENGRASVFYSSDTNKLYKVLRVVPAKGADRSLYRGPLLMLVEKKNKRILSITHPSVSWGHAFRLWWSGNSPSLRAVAAEITSGEYDVSFSPSLWRQVHAWLVVEVQGIQLDKMTMRYDKKGKFW